MCSFEGCKLPSINKKYDLCDKHNYMRLHGRSKQEVYQERASKRIKPVYKISVKVHRVKPQREKEKEIKSKLSVLKDEIRLEAVQNNEYYCWGCGSADGKLDCSHILSVGKYKSLELDKANINLFCRSCHRIWEGNIIEKMGALNTFEKDIEYIKNHDFQRFISLISRIERYLYWNKAFDSQVIRKFANIFEKYPNISCLR